MRADRKIIMKGAAATFAIVAFFLILFPGALVLCMGSESRQDKGEGSGIAAAVELNLNVPVYRHAEKQVVEVPIEEYVKGVVAGEMPATFEKEALKAQSVAARTYALSKIKRSVSGNPKEHPDAPLCDDVHCQVYRTVDELRRLKGDAWIESDYKKICSAVEETSAQVMYYQGSLVEQPLFHSASGGKTENSEDVFASALPYLRSVESPYEEEAPHQQESVSVGLSTFVSKIKKIDPAAGEINKNTIKIVSRSEGGRVSGLQAGNAFVSGRKIRDLFGLCSANFEIKVTDSDIVFTTTGYGHGVGMSQYGANGMAKNGASYLDILTHYYSGVEVRAAEEAESTKKTESAEKAEDVGQAEEKLIGKIKNPLI